MGQDIKFVDSREGVSSGDICVQHLPFKIEYEGTAEVKRNFSSKTFTDPEKDVMRNTFRGKPLVGTRMEVPEDFKGFVLTDFASQKVESDDPNIIRSLHVSKSFNSFAYWNYDQIPSSMDSQQKLKTWLDLSQIVHEPVKKE